MLVFNGDAAFGGAWEDWCDQAADVWAQNATDGKAEEWRSKCKGKPLSFLTPPPNTDAGRLARGLPAEFSTSPSVVQAGPWGKVAGYLNPPQVQPEPPVVTVTPPPGSGGGGGGGGGGGYMTQVQSKLPIIIGVGALAVVALLVMKKKRGGALAGFFGRAPRRRRKFRR